MLDLLWFLFQLIRQLIFFQGHFLNQSVWLKLVDITSQANKIGLQLIHLLVPKATSAAADALAKGTNPVVVLHPLWPIHILQARFAKLPPTNVLVIDLGIASHAISSLRDKSLRNSSLFHAQIFSKISLTLADFRHGLTIWEEFAGSEHVRRVHILTVVTNVELIHALFDLVLRTGHLLHRQDVILVLMPRGCHPIGAQVRKASILSKVVNTLWQIKEWVDFTPVL